MISRPFIVMLLLALTTVAAVSMAVFGHGAWANTVFWYGATLLPVLYIVLAWLGCHIQSQHPSATDGAEYGSAAKHSMGDHV